MITDLFNLFATASFAINNLGEDFSDDNAAWNKHLDDKFQRSLKMGQDRGWEFLGSDENWSYFDTGIGISLIGVFTNEIYSYDPVHDCVGKYHYKPFKSKKNKSQTVIKCGALYKKYYE